MESALEVFGFRRSFQYCQASRVLWVELPEAEFWRTTPGREKTLVRDGKKFEDCGQCKIKPHMYIRN